MDKQYEHDFYTILNEERIKTVYQPIVSLENGLVYGYEALSRILIPECQINIEQLFQLATQFNKLWELEILCRTKALMHAVTKPSPAKLFINVDPNNIYDPKFREGFTNEILQKYGLNPDDIIFEVTEKNCINNIEIFQDVVKHYQKQNYKIAVDDFGSGYSGLNRVCAFSPNFIKIDMELIRNIDSDFVKKSAVGSIVKLCKDNGIFSIAEGIETESELKTIIRLGVNYGQGYFFARPTEKFIETDFEKKQLIKSIRNKMKSEIFQPLIFENVMSICTKKDTVLPNTKSADVYQQMQKDESMSEIGIVDETNYICGVLTRRFLLEKFSGRYGFTLNEKKTVKDLATENYLVVDCGKSIDEVSELAMNRHASNIYDAIFVASDNKYIGTVTVKDLLNAAIKIQVKRASEASPLTGLPGNAAIQSKLSYVVHTEEAFTLIYLDLDNFKAYNDAYGFTNGDKMIKIVADTMQECCIEEDFFGHIGGDDFVIITHALNIQKLCDEIILVFSRAIKPLYSEEDWDQGYIVSTNRNGFFDQFPIATLSIAAVRCGTGDFNNMENLSQKITHAKKKCKQIIGNAVVIV